MDVLLGVRKYRTREQFPGIPKNAGIWKACHSLRVRANLELDPLLSDGMVDVFESFP